MSELLTREEQEAITVLAEAWNKILTLVGEGPTRAQDLAEMVAHIHGLQNAILAQAAARAYPENYRLLGGSCAV